MFGFSAPGLERAAGEVVLAAHDLLRPDAAPSARTRARRGSTRRCPASRLPRGSRRPGDTTPTSVRRTRSCRRTARSGRRRRNRWRFATSTPGVPGPARELVRGQEHRVLAGHVDRQVRAGRCVVPERQRTVPVQQRRDGLGVGDDPGDVGGGRERPDLERRRGGAAPTRGGRDRRGRARPRGSCTTSAPDSRHGSSLEWCSYGPRKTTAPLRSRARTSLSIAPVVPEPQKITASSSLPLTAAWMIRRASSRSSVVSRPVADASVCVFAYAGSTRSRITSSMNVSARPDAV